MKDWQKYVLLLPFKVSLEKISVFPEKLSRTVTDLVNVGELRKTRCVMHSVRYIFINIEKASPTKFRSMMQIGRYE
jgi:hypothetical protein